MRPILLVVGQFVCIAALLFGGGWRLPFWAWGVFTIGLGVFVWATGSLGASNFTIMPEPRLGNQLSSVGIYRHLRHPMYTAVLLCGAACTLGAPTVVRALALVSCVIILVLKVRYEEGRLRVVHPDYDQRMQGVPRLFPFIW